MHANNTDNNNTDPTEAETNLAFAVEVVIPAITALINRAEALASKEKDPDRMQRTEQDLAHYNGDDVLVAVRNEQVEAAKLTAINAVGNRKMRALLHAAVRSYVEVENADKACLDLYKALRAEDLATAAAVGVYIANRAQEALATARIAKSDAVLDGWVARDLGTPEQAEAALWLAYEAARRACRAAELLVIARRVWMERAPEVRRRQRGDLDD